jgi:menaquinone-dependent protoporphyrinogen IX oxidase
MARILVACTTLSGSTVEVAEAIGDEISGQGAEVDLLSLESATVLANYDGVVIGAPMILGWHRSAIRFLRKHREALRRTPMATFATAMSLVSTGETTVSGVPVYVDPAMAKPPRNPQRLTFRENYASITSYASPMLRAAGSNGPVSMAFFGGKLDYFRLKPLPRLFVMVAVQAQPGDRRNWQAIRTWAASLPTLFHAHSITN